MFHFRPPLVMPASLNTAFDLVLQSHVLILVDPLKVYFILNIWLGSIVAT
jgi:hypothetical protein